MHDRLATTDNLLKRGVLVSSMCTLCQEEDDEDIMHVVHSCRFINEVTHILKIKPLASRILDLRDIFEQNRNLLPRAQFYKWIVCLCDTWYQRNVKIRDKSYRNPSELLSLGVVTLIPRCQHLKSFEVSNLHDCLGVASSPCMAPFSSLVPFSGCLGIFSTRLQD
ncbi:hypothetical protein LIER_38659 [Lithospermum erythrorhizon]|uniref:Reverse transcriptase zinc-binding domain-containing protein n=1 Tax=Lithospermum erythrorhizon TaxID=34254 RepID=A0AAV3Q3I3_LITER